MKLVVDPEASDWLDALSNQPEAFEWDRGNQSKNKKHGVSPADVEAMFAQSIVFVGRVVEPIHEEPRWLVLGEDSRGRRLALIFTRRGERLRPISCRAMRRKERQFYEKTLSAEED